MKIVYLDIMLGGLFVAQLPYKVNPIFPATDKELREYVVPKPKGSNDIFVQKLLSYQNKQNNGNEKLHC